MNLYAIYFYNQYEEEDYFVVVHHTYPTREEAAKYVESQFHDSNIPPSHIEDILLLSVDTLDGRTAELDIKLKGGK